MATGQNPWMATKYAQQAQEIAGRNAQAYAQADLLKAQAAAYPGEANARNAASRGQATAGEGQGAIDTANAGQVPGLAASEIQQRAADSSLARAQAATSLSGLAPSPATGIAEQRQDQSLYAPLGGNADYGIPGLAGGTSLVGHMPSFALGYAMGTSTVPGYAGGTTNAGTASGRSGYDGLGRSMLPQVDTPRYSNPNADMSMWHSAPNASLGAPGSAAMPASTPANSGGGQLRMESGSEGRMSNFSAGTKKVPGQGDGTVDTQQAMLAPGEAVLNKAAAEHLGRDTISLLNALGRHKMGLMDEPAQEGSQNQNATTATNQGTTQGYAKGTSAVPARDNQAATAPSKPQAAKAPGKAADGPAKKAAPKPAPKGGKAAPDGAGLSPGLLQAIMQMGSQMGPPGAGGAGMPAPGPAPMPMPMPMSGGR